MLVRWIWPNCDLPAAPCDAFFVECEEAEAQLIRELLSEDELAKVAKRARFDSKPPATFLVSRDLSWVSAEVAHFPYHQLWNGYSPFQPLAPEHRIADLRELAGL